MQTAEHLQHLRTNRSHNTCSECRADAERRFVDLKPWRYDHVHDYLEWIRPRLKAIHKGNQRSHDARWWFRKFQKALEVRISQKMPRAGRKYCDSYLERLGNMRKAGDEAYLRRYARRGASCLDW